jgi:hypothetical protein
MGEGIGGEGKQSNNVVRESSLLMASLRASNIARMGKYLSPMLLSDVNRLGGYVAVRRGLNGWQHPRQELEL